MTFKIGDRVRERQVAMMKNLPNLCALFGCDGSVHDTEPALGTVVDVSRGLIVDVRIDDGASEHAGHILPYMPDELELIDA